MKGRVWTCEDAEKVEHVMATLKELEAASERADVYNILKIVCNHCWETLDTLPSSKDFD